MLMLKKSNLQLIETTTSSKGNQIKYKYGSHWIKQNTFGYEALAEVLCSRLAQALGVAHVEYIPAAVVDEYEYKVPACISKDFVGDFCEVSLGRLVEARFGREFDLAKINSLSERVAVILEALCNKSPYLNNERILQYLNLIVSFDALIFNEDRHLHNILFLQTPCGLVDAPIFDNGAGLFSDTHIDYPLNLPLNICVMKVKAKPFSSSFKKQVDYFNDICGEPFKNVTEVFICISDLFEYFSTSHIDRAVSALRCGLQTKAIKLITDKDSTMVTNIFSK